MRPDYKNWWVLMDRVGSAIREVSEEHLCGKDALRKATDLFIEHKFIEEDIEEIPRLIIAKNVVSINILSAYAKCYCVADVLREYETLLMKLEICETAFKN
jgi:hypothetical protein